MIHHGVEDYAAIYHFWNWRTPTPWSNDALTIIQSLATLRYHDPKLPAYVIDISGQDWGPYPELLRFTVLRRPALLERHVRRSDLPVDRRSSFELLSQPHDVFALSRELPQRYFVYCDQDVLWHDSPRLSPPPSGFHSLGDNLGLYHFDGASEGADDVWHLWRAFTAFAPSDPAVWDRATADFGMDFLMDESIFVHLLRRYRPRGHVELDDRDNCWYRGDRFLPGSRNHHFLSTQYGFFGRSRLPFMVREYAAALRVMLGAWVERHFGDCLVGEGSLGLADLVEFRKGLR